MTEIQSWFMGILPYFGFFFLVLIMDIGGGAMVAWQKGEFKVEELPRAFQTASGYLVAWLLAELMAFGPTLLHLEVPQYADVLAEVAPKAVYGYIIATKYATSLVSHIQFLRDRPDLNQ